MLETVLGDLGLDMAARAFKVGELWGEVVGQPGAQHSRPVGVRGDVLEISVDSSVWCHQLQLEKGRLLAGLRARLGDEAPADIRFRLA
jgi:predicted nucleic acid-binding Zn ribbon protein